MNNLRCQKCGYGIDKHGDVPGLGFYDAEASTMGVFYPCPLSKGDVLHAAQHADALAHLRELAIPILKSIRESGEPMATDWAFLCGAISAYRAIGVLNSPKENPNA